VAGEYRRVVRPKRAPGNEGRSPGEARRGRGRPLGEKGYAAAAREAVRVRRNAKRRANTQASQQKAASANVVVSVAAAAAAAVAQPPRTANNTFVSEPEDGSGGNGEPGAGTARKALKVVQAEALESQAAAPRAEATAEAAAEAAAAAADPPCNYE